MLSEALSADVLKFLKSFRGSKMGNEKGKKSLCRVKTPGASQSPCTLA